MGTSQNPEFLGSRTIPGGVCWMLEDFFSPHSWPSSNPNLCTKALFKIFPSQPLFFFFPCGIYLFCSLFGAQISFILVCRRSLGPAGQLVLELPEDLCVVGHGAAVVPEGGAAGGRAGVWAPWKDSMVKNVKFNYCKVILEQTAQGEQVSVEWMHWIHSAETWESPLSWLSQSRKKK